MQRRHKKRKFFVAIGFIALLIGLFIFVFSGENSEILKELFRLDSTREEIQELLKKLGVKGYVTIGILSMLQVVIAVLPAEPIQVIAGISFGFLRGSAICLAGVIVGNTVIYILYRIYGDKMRDFFEKNVEFDFESAKNSPKIALIVFILYFLPAIPYGLICFFTASMNVKYPKYILLTGLGAIPSIFIGVGLGHIAMASSWIISICVFAILVTLLLLLYKNKSVVFKKVNQYVKNKSLPYSSKTTVREANPFVYSIANFISRILFNTRIKVRIKREVQNLERPSIVLCNHGSFTDFVFAGQLLAKEKTHFITARLYFYRKDLGTLLRSVGCFPKSMFSSDIENAKNCMRVVSSNGIITIMPEARLSTVGKFEGIQDTTYKFIQKMNLPTYTLRMQGSYFANPKWGDKVRKGALIEGSLKPLFKAGEAKTLSLEEIQQRVDEALIYDEFEWLKTKPQLRYRSKTLAQGLENILFLCPKCKEKYSISTKGRRVYCEKCGFETYINDRYDFENNPYFENFGKWYEYQTEEMKKEILSSPDFCLRNNVTLKHASLDGKKLLRTAGNGVCILDKTGLTYKGSRDGNEITKFFPLSDIYRLLFGAGEDFEIYEGSEIWYFVPDELRSCVVWYMASGLLKEIYESER